MAAICIVDTTVFCNLLNVPNRSQQHEETVTQLAQYVDQRDHLLLPLATIYETGNHIAQNGDGRQRRATASLFAQQVREALDGTSPFTPTPVPGVSEMTEWLAEFPDRAAAKIGFGDLSIIKLFEQTCAKNRARRVFIWSYDDDLDGYDRPPEL